MRNPPALRARRASNWLGGQDEDPTAEPREKPAHNWLKYPSQNEHVYGAAHVEMRRQVLAEEPQCRSCGAPSKELDHIKPISSGGATKRENLQALCRPCHLSTSGREANFHRWHVLRIPKCKASARG